MSHSKLLKQKFTKTGVQGLRPLPGFGVSPKYSFSPFCAPPQAAREERKGGGDTPRPGKGLAALCHPA